MVERNANLCSTKLIVGEGIAQIKLVLWALAMAVGEYAKHSGSRFWLGSVAPVRDDAHFAILLLGAALEGIRQLRRGVSENPIEKTG